MFCDPDQIADHYRDVRQRLHQAGRHYENDRRISFEEREKREAKKLQDSIERQQAEAAAQAELVRARWAELIEKARQQVPPLKYNEILAQVSRDSRVSLADIKSHSRSHHHVLARHLACYRLHCETTLSLTAIGRVLGGRDHSTILHAVRKHAQRNGLSIVREVRS